MDKNFTDKVMAKIAVEMAAREKKHNAWMIVLYSVIGAVSLTGIFYALIKFELISLVPVPIASSAASFFGSLHQMFSSLNASLSSYKILIMVCALVLFFYAISEILSQRRKA